jgi:hypothetical protein
MGDYMRFMVFKLMEENKKRFRFPFTANATFLLPSAFSLQPSAFSLQPKQPH